MPTIYPLEYVPGGVPSPSGAPQTDVSSSLELPEAGGAGNVPCSVCRGITNEVGLEVYRCSDGAGPYYYSNVTLNGGPIPANIIGLNVKALPNNQQPCAQASFWGLIWRVTDVLPTGGPNTSNNAHVCVDLELVLDPCLMGQLSDTWDCRWSKFTGQGCIKDTQGGGTYNSLQDCQNNCISELVFKDNFRDIIEPWTDPGGGSCLHDIKTCPCGWDYVQNYQPPDPTPPQQPVYTQFTGTSVCLSPDYALWESTLGSAAPNSTFHGLMSPFSLPCANLQGAHNPTVGMTIEGSPTTALGNYLAGSITNTINNVPTTYTWDKHVIVEVNPAFNSSILNPNLQVIQSTPC